MNWKEALLCQEDLGGAEFLIEDDSLLDWFPKVTNIPRIDTSLDEKPKKKLSEIAIPDALRKKIVAAPKPVVSGSLEDLYSEIYQEDIYKQGSKHQPILSGNGPSNPHLMVVGFAPTSDDLTLKSPFSGAGGELLRKMLQAIEIEKNLCYQTYLFKGAVVPKLMPRDRMGLLKYLEREIQLVAPKALLVLGEPLMRLCKVGNSLEQVELLPNVFAGIPTVATFDSNYLLSNPEFKRTSWMQLKQLQEQMKAV